MKVQFSILLSLFTLLGATAQAAGPTQALDCFDGSIRITVVRNANDPLGKPGSLVATILSAPQTPKQKTVFSGELILEGNQTIANTMKFHDSKTGGLSVRLAIKRNFHGDMPDKSQFSFLTVPGGTLNRTKIDEDLPCMVTAAAFPKNALR